MSSVNKFTKCLLSARPTWTSTGLILLGANTFRISFHVSKRQLEANHAPVAPLVVVVRQSPSPGYLPSLPSSLLRTLSSFTGSLIAIGLIWQALMALWLEKIREFHFMPNFHLCVMCFVIVEKAGVAYKL